MYIGEVPGTATEKKTPILLVSGFAASGVLAPETVLSFMSLNRAPPG
jgi:hypothetical protein